MMDNNYHKLPKVQIRIMKKYFINFAVSYWQSELWIQNDFCRHRRLFRGQIQFLKYIFHLKEARS